MKILLIGGTGSISTNISRKLIKDGQDLYLLNRGYSKNILGEKGVTYITCDINDEKKVSEWISDLHFDVIADFTAFKKEDIERDYRLFKGKTDQYIFISSATVYQKLMPGYVVTEGTSLGNPYSEYAQNKIECEIYLTRLHREEFFPITIVRPSWTYDERVIPLSVTGNNGGWQVIKRMMEGKKVIIHGDGSNLWTMTHASDFAVGFIGLMGNVHAIGEAFHITSDESLTWYHMYKIVADALGVEFKPIFVSTTFLDGCSSYGYKSGIIGDKGNSLVFDNTKIKRFVPEFKAVTRFDQGIKETVAYYLKHPEMQIEDKEFDTWCDRVIQTLEEAMIKINKH